MSPRSRPRPYQKRERARQEEATRRRITEAAVELHGTIGPARTTVTDLARLAGVSRMTVYNHFPTEHDIFVACSSHWAAAHPFPDPGGWVSAADPADRLSRALGELYRWYQENQGMLANVLRDTPLLPSIQPVMAAFWSPYLNRVVATLARGWSVRRGERTALRAMFRLAVEFSTWQVLTAAGLSSARAAERAGRMVLGAIDAQPVV
jgi:AcrR family transcriptional regulator